MTAAADAPIAGEDGAPIAAEGGMPRAGADEELMALVVELAAEEAELMAKTDRWSQDEPSVTM